MSYQWILESFMPLGIAIFPQHNPHSYLVDQHILAHEHLLRPDSSRYKFQLCLTSTLADLVQGA